MIPIEEARRLILQEAVPLPPEAVPLAESLGMALARAIVAPHDVPPFANSAMDGFAVRAVDTHRRRSQPRGRADPGGDHPGGVHRTGDARPRVRPRRS